MLILDIEPVQENQCKGDIFKANVSLCKTERGVLFSVRLNKMKRLSCPGCKYCGWLDDDLNELDPERFPLLGIENVEHGKLYTITTTNVSRDFETGWIDSWDLEVVEVKP